MRIVHVIARLNDGGPARVVAALARTMRARGHVVTILCGATDEGEPDLAGELAASGLAIERIAGLGRRASPLRDLRALLAILARLRALRADVVHTHTAKAGVLGRLAAAIGRRARLHTYHGHVLSGYFAPPVNAVVRAVERLLARGAQLHALTRSQARELGQRFAIGARARWHVLPPPVEPVRTRDAAWHGRIAAGGQHGGVARIGFLGRLAAVKDVPLWLDAFERLAQRRRVVGIVCGEGRDGASARALVAQRGLPVRFIGCVPAGEALAVFDLLLMTSRNEGLPLAAIEALSLGVPVVAPLVGGLADLDRAGAIWGAARDADALATACERALDEQDLRAQRSARGLALARALTPERLARRYDALYHAVQR